MYLGWNDYELLYLIEEGNSKALDLMYLKYRPFIILKARACNFPSYMFEDLVQEGYLVLTKALKTYKSSYNKSFTKYFELILLRRFWALHKITFKNKYTELPDEAMVISNYEDETSFYFFKSKLSEFEAIVFEEVYKNKVQVKYLAEKLNVKLYVIYRTMQKIKEKLREEFDIK